ncbi:MAG: DNA primase, partial [Clostridia bacterium]|nr:DNA primase [Clostridia bacterium]
SGEGEGGDSGTPDSGEGEGGDSGTPDSGEGEGGDSGTPDSGEGEKPDSGEEEGDSENGNNGCKGYVGSAIALLAGVAIFAGKRFFG